MARPGRVASLDRTYRGRPVTGEKRTEGKRRGRSAVVVDIIPPQDARALKDAGVAAVYMSKDFALNWIIANLVRIVEVAADRGK